MLGATVCIFLYMPWLLYILAFMATQRAHNTSVSPPVSRTQFCVN